MTKKDLTIVIIALVLRIFMLVLVIWAGISVGRELVRYYLDLPHDWYILGAYLVVIWVVVDLLFSGRGRE